MRILVIAFTVTFTLANYACSKSQQMQQGPEGTKQRVVWIAKDGNVSRTYTVRNQTLGDRFPEPGDIILFRTAESLGAMGAGKVGEAYRLDSAKKLQLIGAFDSKKSDEELVREYETMLN